MAAAIRLSQQHSCSLDHLVGAADQRQRNGKAEGLGSLQVDDQLDFGGLLDRQIGLLLALENPGGVATGQAVRFRNITLVAHETAGQGKRTVLVNGGHPVATRQCAELFAPRVEKYIRANHDSAGFQLG